MRLRTGGGSPCGDGGGSDDRAGGNPGTNGNGDSNDVNSNGVNYNGNEGNGPVLIGDVLVQRGWQGPAADASGGILSIGTSNPSRWGPKSRRHAAESAIDLNCYVETHVGDDRVLQHEGQRIGNRTHWWSPAAASDAHTTESWM